MICLEVYFVLLYLSTFLLNYKGLWNIVLTLYSRYGIVLNKHDTWKANNVPYAPTCLYSFISYKHPSELSVQWQCLLQQDKDIVHAQPGELGDLKWGWVLSVKTQEEKAKGTKCKWCVPLTFVPSCWGQHWHLLTCCNSHCLVISQLIIHPPFRFLFHYSYEKLKEFSLARYSKQRHVVHEL